MLVQNNEMSGGVSELIESYHRLQRQLADHERMEKRLWRSNMELQQFAYTAAHDLKQPVRTASLFLNVLEHRVAERLEAEDRDCLQQAMTGVQRLGGLIDSLLHLAKVDQGRLTFEVVEMQDALDEAMANLQAFIQETQAAITCEALPPVRGDRRQFVHLWQNLLENAMRYRSEDAPKIEIHACQKAGEVVFSVHDNGIGIEPENAEAIFELFYRGPVLGDSSGIGIGLAMCRHIVESHGGRIWVGSQVGHGSTFFFSLSQSESAT